MIGWWSLQAACATVQNNRSAFRTAGRCGPLVEGAERMAGRILLVDDDPMVRGLGERMITALGFTCDAVPDGFTALDRLGAAGGDYRAVVTDLMMPEMTGSELLEALERHYPTLPVVVASGDTVAADALRGRRRPGRSVLIKPYRLQELGESLRAAIDSRATGDGECRVAVREESVA